MNKSLKVMTSAALLAGVVAPVAVTTVDAAGSISVLQVPTVSVNSTADLGTVKIVIPAGSATTGETITIKLIGAEFTTTAPSLDYDKVPTGFALTPVDNTWQNNDTIKLTVNKDVNLNQDASVFIKLNDILVKKSGEIKAEVIASAKSGIPSGTAVIANAAKEGSVAVSAGGTEASNDKFKFKLRLKESVANAIEDSKDYIELKLPSGFKWSGEPSNSDITSYYGDSFGIDNALSEADDDELKIYFDRTGTSNDSYFEVELEFEVEDPTVAKQGDVVAAVDADGFDIDVTELTVGYYGDYAVEATSEANKDVYSGKAEQKIADVKIKEKLTNTLINGRTITLTLPEGVEWHSDMAGVDSTEDEGVQLVDASLLSSNRVLKLTVDSDVNASNISNYDPAELELEGLKINVSPDFTGDIVAEIGGSAGVRGELKLAKSVASITATASEKTELIIGDTDLAIADIEITEAAKGMFEKSSGKVQLQLPSGFEWDGTPDVEVVEGDLAISGVKADGGILEFDVKSDSFKPSKIKVSNGKVKVYRSVPEGDVVVKIVGDDIVDPETKDINNASAAAKVVVATVVTPAAGKGTAVTSVFTIGSTTYTVDGKEYTLDVAPFVEAATGRTYLPVRYVANAVGVSGQNILWDQATQTATIIKGDRVAQLTVGSNILKLNGDRKSVV